MQFSAGETDRKHSSRVGAVIFASLRLAYVTFADVNRARLYFQHE